MKKKCNFISSDYFRSDNQGRFKRKNSNWKQASFANIFLLKNNLISRRADQAIIRRFERITIRRIYGQVGWVRNSGDPCKMTTLLSLSKYRGADGAGLPSEWRMPKKVMTAKIHATRRQGRRRLRCQDQVCGGLKVITATGSIAAVKALGIWWRVVKRSSEKFLWGNRVC